MSRLAYLSLILFLSSLLITMTSCEKDDPEIPNESEVITTVKYRLQPTDGGAPVEFVFLDADGDGGNAPVITNPTLSINKTYTGTLQLLNEIAQPIDNITSEVLEEAEEHQLFYSTTAPGMTITYDDADADGLPLGLETTLTTTTAGQGTLRITLRHEPIKTAQGVATGDITNAGGETDVEVTFVVNVQ